MYTSYVRYTEACLIYADSLLTIAQCLHKDNAEQLQPSKRDEILTCYQLSMIFLLKLYLFIEGYYEQAIIIVQLACYESVKKLDVQYIVGFSSNKLYNIPCNIKSLFVHLGIKVLGVCILNLPHDAHTWLLHVGPLLKRNHIKKQFSVRTLLFYFAC